MIEKTCEYCNKLFYTYKSRDSKYCSSTCYNASRIGKVSPRKGKGKDAFSKHGREVMEKYWFKKGQNPWNTNKEWPKEVRDKISKARKGFVVSSNIKEKISDSLLKFYSSKEGKVKRAEFSAKRLGKKCPEHSLRMLAKNLKYPIPEDKLILEYVKEEKTLREVAKLNGCSVPTVCNRLRDYGIHIRTVSEARIGKFIGKDNNRYGKASPQIKRIKYKNTCMRSSYEVAYAKYLDENNIKWEYEKKIFEIVYNDNGVNKEGTYRPDFYLPETDEYIEIKGWWRYEDRERFTSFKNTYPNIKIKVLMKKELKELEIKVL